MPRLHRNRLTYTNPILSSPPVNPYSLLSTQLSLRVYVFRVTVRSVGPTVPYTVITLSPLIYFS